MVNTDDPQERFKKMETLSEVVSKYRGKDITDGDMNAFLEVITSALRWDPEKRMSADKLLKMSWLQKRAERAREDEPSS